MTKILPATVITLVALGLGSALMLQVPAVQNTLMNSVIERRVANVPTQLFEDDSLHALLCGTGSPMPNKNRAGPCVAIIAGGKFYIVDAGNRSTNNLGQFRLPGELIGGVFTTHFHSDHIGDLGELNMNTWVQGRKEALRAFGPPGIEQVVAGFNQAYALDREYRIAHHGSAVVAAEGSVIEAIPFSADAPIVVLEENGLKVTMFPIDHPPVEPAVGYRFDYNGRSVVVSGDTIKSDKVVAAAKDADLLIHEAMAKNVVKELESAFASINNRTLETIMVDIREYHTTPVEAAEVANAAGVRELALYHLVPSPPNTVAEKVFMRGVSKVRPQGVTLGYDCLMYTLPANSDDIDKKCLARN